MTVVVAVVVVVVVVLLLYYYYYYCHSHQQALHRGKVPAALSFCCTRYHTIA